MTWSRLGHDGLGGESIKHISVCISDVTVQEEHRHDYDIYTLTPFRPPLGKNSLQSPALIGSRD